MTVEQLGWYLFGGACVLLLLGINMFLKGINKVLERIDKKMDWFDKWRAEEKAAIEELQGRCALQHRELGPIKRELSSP